jgi:UDP-glucoronosyl and UDP-glucosyl transferase
VLRLKDLEESECRTVTMGGLNGSVDRNGQGKSKVKSPALQNRGQGTRLEGNLLGAYITAEDSGYIGGVTALEALAQGVPMVAIPIGFDQPGVATRVAYHGTGEFVEIGDLTAERLSELIQRVRRNPRYRDKARYFQKVIAETRGLDLAANVIERALKKNQTVDSDGERAALSHA